MFTVKKEYFTDVPYWTGLDTDSPIPDHDSFPNTFPNGFCGNFFSRELAHDILLYSEKTDTLRQMVSIKASLDFLYNLLAITKDKLPVYYKIAVCMNPVRYIALYSNEPKGNIKEARDIDARFMELRFKALATHLRDTSLSISDAFLKNPTRELLKKNMKYFEATKSVLENGQFDLSGRFGSEFLRDLAMSEEVPWQVMALPPVHLLEKKDINKSSVAFRLTSSFIASHMEALCGKVGKLYEPAFTTNATEIFENYAEAKDHRKIHVAYMWLLCLGLSGQHINIPEADVAREMERLYSGNV